MISFPNAKINLGLNIIGKREDGYHNIESGFYPIPWHDSLEIVASKDFSFQSYGLEIPGDSASNLCVKAYHLLKETFDIPPVAIHLLKKIPMGAGLGGGSADGAFALKLINDLFKLELADAQLEAFALRLGSDCPFFIENKAAIANGRGEQLKVIDLDLKGYYMAIHNPGIHISTKEAYAGIAPKTPSYSITNLLQQPVSIWKDHLVNDFEHSIFPHYPEIEKLNMEMYTEGALYASMTGSGSTVYGIFEEEKGVKDWKWIEL